MSEETEALQEAIHFNREHLLNAILEKLGYSEINEELFQELMLLIEKSDQNRFKYSKALEGQKVIEEVLKDRLV